MRTACILIALAAAGGAHAGEAVDWLPDMTVDRVYLLDTAVSQSVQPGRTHLLLSNATPNVGLGDLYVFGLLPANDDGSQDVMQRVFRSDGSFRDRPAGRFVHHPAHEHIHLEGWALYRLRTVLPGNGAGEVVAQGEKTSYCLRDSRPYDPSLENFSYPGRYHNCEGLVQGISVGFEDLYSKDLPDQWIDITDVPPGQYWLESEVDPDDHILEADETNNVDRVKVTIGATRPQVYPRLVRFVVAVRTFLGWGRRLFGGIIP